MFFETSSRTCWKLAADSWPASVQARTSTVGTARAAGSTRGSEHEQRQSKQADQYVAGVIRRPRVGAVRGLQQREARSVEVDPELHLVRVHEQDRGENESRGAAAFTSAYGRSKNIAVPTKRSGAT